MNRDQLKKLEKDLWSAADKLRANSDLKASEYSTPVLGLIFLKFADNKYRQHEAAILAEYEKLKGTRRERRLEDIAVEKCGFYLDKVARYEHLLHLPGDQDIVKAIQAAMKSIERSRPELEGVLPQQEYDRFSRKGQEERGHQILRALLRQFSDIPADASGDVFGQIYEYFLGEFALSEGQGGGEFFTPRSVVRLMVEIIEPHGGAVFDPACGSGGMFVQSAQFIEQHQQDADASADVYVCGAEKTLETVKLAKMNLAVNSLRAPYTADGDYTFAGARLVMATGGNLLFKSNSNHTIGNLVLDGGRIHNGSNGNGLVTVGGNILVRGASELYAQNGSLTVNSLVSGTGNLSLVAANGTVTFTRANTWTGSLAAESPFALGATGSFNFFCGASGVNNAITGSKAVTLDGTVNIDTTGAGTTIGDAWNLVANTGAKNYGATFSITGFSRSGTAWKKSIDAARAYQFEQTTGVLAVVANSDSDNDGMLDAWEMTHFGNLAQTAAGDPDADGTDNLAEFRLGLDPNSSASRFGIATTDTNPADGFTIAWPSAAGVTFTVKRTTDMATWTTLTATLPAGSGGSTQYTDPSPPAGKAFYRVELNP